MKKRLIATTAAAGLLLTATACGSPSAASAEHSETPKATSNVVTSRAHVYGSGAERWFLTLRGKPVSVPKTTYKRCQIGEHYPACAAG